MGNRGMAGILVLVVAVATVTLLSSAIYGLYLAFSASVLLGFVVLVVEPAPLVLGLAAVFGHPEIASKLAAWMHLPV